jgi:hypothetical protein
VAVLGAALVIGLLVNAAQQHTAEVKKETDAVTGFYRAISEGGPAAAQASQNLTAKQQALAAAQANLDSLIAASKNNMNDARIHSDSYGFAISQARQKVADLSGELSRGEAVWRAELAAMTPMQRVTADVAKAQADLQLAIQNYGPASQAASLAAHDYRVALGQQKAMQDLVNQSESTEEQNLQALAQLKLAAISSTLGAAQAQLQFKQSVDQYNASIADGTLKGDAAAIAQQALAQQALSVAQSAGDAAAAEAKQNGVTDTGTISNFAMLQSLKQNAAHLTGPGKAAIDQAIRDLEAATRGHNTFAQVVQTAGGTFVRTWHGNGVELAGVTGDEIKHLESLGVKVKTLPNGNVGVTADTTQGQKAIDSFIAGVQNKTVTIFASLASAHNLALTSNPAVNSGGGRARGGWTGPGAKYTPVDVVHADEFVFTKEQTNAAGVSNLYAMAAALDSGSAGYSGGGFVTLPKPGGVAPYGGPGPYNPNQWHMNLHPSVKVNLGFRQTVDQVVAWLKSIFAPPIPPSAGGGAPVPGAPAAAGGNVGLVQSMAAARGWTGAQWNALYTLIMHESGFRNTAQNPTSTAYGMFQFLNSTWAGTGYGKTSDPRIQALAGFNYIASRYGSPIGAWNFWSGHHWYDQGGLWPSGTAGMNMSGADERVLSPPQDDYFRRFVDATTQSGQHHGQFPVWHFYLGDREITDLVDTRLEWRDNEMFRDVRSGA